MSMFLTDNLTGTNGTNYTAHTPDSGGAITLIGGRNAYGERVLVDANGSVRWFCPSPGLAPGTSKESVLMIAALNAVGQSVDVQIVDDNGLPVLSLVAATFPTLLWSRAGAHADVGFPALFDLPVLTSPWVAGGVKERGGGYYRLDLSDEIFQTAGEVKIRGEESGKHLLVSPIDVVAGWYTVPDNTNIVLGASAAINASDNSIDILNILQAETDPLAQVVPGAYLPGTAGYALGRIGSGQIITVAPVAQNGSVAIVRGDDYFLADGRALEWTDSSANWPDLTAATIELGVQARLLVVAGSVVIASGPGKKVRVELNRAQTLTLQPNRYTFDVVATLSDGHKATLVASVLTVKTNDTV